MKYKFKDKVVVITGASQGIGEAVARELAKKGSKVVIAARSEDKLNSISRDINEQGGNAVSIKTDVTNIEEIRNLSKNVLDKWGKIDIWVNNAGVGMSYNSLFAKEEWVDTIFKVNLQAVYWGSRFAAHAMMKNESDPRGIIVNISSLTTELPMLPGSVLYKVTKIAVDYLSEGMALELENFKIKVINIKPGFTATNFGQNVLSGKRDDKDYNKEGFLIFKSVPPETVAKKIVKEIEKGRSNKRVIITKSDRFNIGLVNLLGALVRWAIKKEFKKDKYLSSD
ncbi:MAG: SDR family NAD(P)-dependent oxidoreductase [Candidatus Helarchaeota archaeon]